MTDRAGKLEITLEKDKKKGKYDAYIFSSEEGVYCVSYFHSGRLQEEIEIERSRVLEYEERYKKHDPRGPKRDHLAYVIFMGII